MRRLLGTCAACGILLLAAAARGAEPQWNVILVDICSARADHFGLYGYSKDTTPNLDRLSKEMVVFDRAVAQSSWCLPNYASLFTGHVPEVHGLYTNKPFRPLPAQERTLSQMMKDAGYATAAFSGGIYFLRAWGLDKGFDTYVNAFSTATATPASFAQTMPGMLDWVEKNKKAPFFLYAAVDDLHAPYQSGDPEKYDRGYSGVVHDTDTINMRFFRDYNEAGALPEALSPKLAAFRADPRHLAHLAAHYDAALNSADAKIAEFIRRLKAAGLWERTVLIVTADHGELLGEHGLLGHTQGLYEPVLHVPLMIHHPQFGGLNGKRLAQLVQRVDLTPTVLDIAGVSYEDRDLQGESLIPLLEEPARTGREFAYASSKRNMASVSDLNVDERVIRDRRWKLHWYLYKDRFELYDLQEDPAEAHEVSGQHPDVVQRLAFELLRQVELKRPHAPGPSGPPQEGATAEIKTIRDAE